MVGLMVRGVTLCLGGTVWQVVQPMRAWGDTLLMLVICAWQAEHSRGTSGGTGS